MIAVTIGITMKMDGTIALIAMSIATDRTLSHEVRK
jgi:hypothetical protein